ncbi:uncharacterized protein LOC116299089 isoform X2 [Actinia tenebrosa]|uniref:Uncharacterized protein LOC116299089 isoform X2 n=1 Tax=Actinia tenebrosa TaxID=6105 RepID=A0A6P8I4U6_ACTTE|nr:uncharacterized protein LOC116299089 isoform X2 [Actinia tenebrosa]
MDRSDKLVAINQTLPGLESFLREVLGKEGLSIDAEEQRQEFIKRLETISTPPALPPRPPRLAARAQALNDSGSKIQDEEDLFTNSLYRNDSIDDPVAFASHQRELSRHYTFSSRGYVGRRELFGENSPLYSPQPLVTQPTLPAHRDSIQSCSSDEIYERLSIGEAFKPGESTSDVSEREISAVSNPVPSIGQRGGTGRGSGGKGKITTGWFKKETKPQAEVHLSDIQDPIIQGYLRDVKSNKRRWCVLKDEKLYIFKSRDEPTNQIIDLPNCDIGVDDKKKISYSFRLQQTGAPLVQLAIEAGHDLSPWMSAIMAAAVRRGKTYRPTSPLENTCSLEEAQGKARSPYGYMRIDIRQEEQEDGASRSSTYEVPLELLPEMMSSYGHQLSTSTPTSTCPDTEKLEPYNPPLPPVPINSDSSSESSSEDEEDYEDGRARNKPSKGRKTSRANVLDKDIKITDSKAEGDENRRSFHDDSHGTDSPSDQSINRLSFGEAIASDEASEPRGERTGSIQRKRSSTVLSSVSVESTGSYLDLAQKEQHPPRKSTLTTGPRMKRRRKQTAADTESKFLQDPNAFHSGILFQKRPLGVWSKRYCKLIADKLMCYRHADDEKPSLIISLKEQDVCLTDSKESKKAYAFKVGRPGQETYYFGTDSRVSVERWIELLSLAATGRQDIMAPYPPYFKSGSGDEIERSKSQESLSLSEDIDSGDTLDFIDSSSTQTSSRDGYPYDDIGSFAADELDEDLSSDAREDHTPHPKNRNHRVKSPNRRSPRHHTGKGGVRERAMKRKKEKQKGTGPGSPTSPPQSGIFSDSGAENRPEGNDETGQATAAENRASAVDSKKDKKGWAESLKLKQARFSRGHSFSAIITGTTGTPASEVSKTRLQAIKKTNIQSYTHLLSLFDKEGRFSGFLTEVKVSKYSTTQLRRWCVVKNGALNLYNKQTEEAAPAVKLNLAEMWLTDSKDEAKHKYSFDLHDKDGKTYTFQVASKEEFDKWYGILKVFTEIRIERPVQTSTTDDTEKVPTQDREVGPQKGDRPVSRGKDDGTSVNTFVKRPSIRMKFSQKVSVMDLFKRSHTSYDFENPVPGDIIPTEDIKCINYTGGQLTEVCVTEDHYTWSRARWCTIKDSELLIFADNVGGDPVKRIPLYNVRIEEACEPDKEVYRFKIHKSNDTLIFVAKDKLDCERWVNQLRSASSMYGKDDHENSKCRIPSPRVFSHRRTRSETLPQMLSGAPSPGVSSSASSPEKRLSYGSASVSTGSEDSTDTLMNGHLNEVIPNKKGKNTDSKLTWCVVTSEFFFQYDSEDVTNPSRKWKLTEVNAKEENKDTLPNSFGFSLQCGEETVSYRHENQEVITQWLSVLYRYCKPADDDISPVLPRKDSGRYKAKSQDNIKTEFPDPEKRFLRKTLSEGKASGKKLLRKISEDNLLHKYRRAEVFKVPWKGSLDRLNVRHRDHMEPSVSARDLERRFSCGSLFDSEGKYSGYLVELVTRPLCRSEVRRWCVVRDDCFFVYEQPRVETPRKIIQLKHVELINEGKMNENKFVFRLDYGADESAVFKAMSRTDFEKWITAITVKLAVLKSRIQRQEQRKGFVIDEDEEFDSTEPTPSTTNDTLVPTNETFTEKHPSEDTQYLKAHPRTHSEVSNDSVFIREQVTPTNITTDETNKVEYKEGETHSIIQDTDDVVTIQKEKPDKEVSEILENLEKVTLSESLRDVPTDDDVINLGSLKIPWSAVIAEEEEKDKGKDKFETEPIYQNYTEIGVVEPIYQNRLEVISEGSTGTLSQLEIEQIDLNSHEGRMNYRKFKEGFLANPEESMFVDMLPKRHSDYDLGPLYDNLHFLQNQEPQGKPLWSVRPSKDHDEVFVPSGPHTSLKSPKEFGATDRRSMASDYSGIVGESLLEEAGSFSGNTTRSGTLSSQSGVDPRDLQSMDSAFDKELLEDILGLNVTSEEAAEISEYCAKCDEERDSLQSIDTRSDTLTDRQSKSDVFFDAASDFENGDPTTDSKNRTSAHDQVHDQAHANLGRDLRSSSGASIHDTYFGRSSSDEEDEVYEDSSQGFLTAESSPCHKPLSAAINLNLNEEPESRDKLTAGFVNNLDRRSRGESSEDDTINTYFGRSSVSDLEDHNIEDKPDQSDQLAQLRELDEAIVSVGAVLPSNDGDGFHRAQSSFDNCLDNSKTTNTKTQSNNQTTYPEMTNSSEAGTDTDTVNLRNKSGMIDSDTRKELTKSEAEFIKAVTDAFKDITKLSSEDDGSEDTKF